MLSVLGLVVGGVLSSKAWGEVMLVLGLGMGLFVLKTSDAGVVETSELFEMDSLSSSLVLLSIWVVTLAILGSSKIKAMGSESGLFIGVGVFLLFFLMLSFGLSGYLLFYMSFESCLVPILLMILGWGYQPERAEAGLYMMMYTLLGSLPLFYVIVSSAGSSGSSYMYLGAGVGGFGLAGSVFLVGAFLVKFPMYGVHLWLLKAHVEAPVAGSMILAGVLLKLGGYGLIRFLVFFDASSLMFEAVVGLSLWGGFMVSLSCLRQTDMKLLVASSSVVHMGSCIGGLFVLSEMGHKGCVGLMVAHGLCSSGLFYLVNLVYERSHSRSMLLSKGLLNLMPSMSLWWFLMVAANMAAPPTINLLSEIMLIVSLVAWSGWSMSALALVSFFGAAYSLYLYSLSQHGTFFFSKSGFQSGRLVEFLGAWLHWAPLNLLVVSFYYLV